MESYVCANCGQERSRRLSINEEKHFIVQLINCGLPQWHVLNIKWATQYTKYLTGDGMQPREIDNRNLMSADGCLRPDKHKDYDYVLINEHVWRFISAIHGGGPEIREKPPQIMLMLDDPTEVPSREPTQIQDFRKSSDPTHSQVLRNYYFFSPKNSTPQPPQPSDDNLQSIPEPDSIYLDDYVNYKNEEQRSTYLSLNQLPSQELPIVGIRNSRFYCYINSVLQCLLAIPQLNWFFLNMKELKTKKKIIHAYQEFLNNVNKLKSGQVVSSSIVYQEILSKFSQHEMHDSHEFLIYIMGIWQDALKKPNQSRREINSPEEAFLQYCQNNQTIIDELFVGQFQSSIKCRVCGEVSLSFDPFNNISLSLDQGRQYMKDLSLNDCFKLFFREESIEGWKCGKCHNKQKVKRSMCITHTPNILIIHLKRFSIFPRNKKIKDPVALKMELDLKKYPQNNIPAIALNSYRIPNTDQRAQSYTRATWMQDTMFRQHADKERYYDFQNQWFIFDDENIHRIMPHEVSRLTHSYILFYEKNI